MLMLRMIQKMKDWENKLVVNTHIEGYKIYKEGTKA
jgi:hypothetical protein